MVRRGRVDAHVDALIAARDDAAAEAARRERQGEVIINGNVYHSPPAGGPAPGAKAPRVASTSLASHLVSPTRARARSGAARRHTAEGVGMAPLRTRKHEWSLPDESAPQQSQGGSYFGVRSSSAATAAAAAADSAVYSDTFPLMSGNSPVVLPAGREFQLLSAHNHSHSHYRQASMDGREVAVDLVQQVRTSTFAARGGEGALEIEENMEDRVRGVQRQSVLVSLAQSSPSTTRALQHSTR